MIIKVKNMKTQYHILNGDSLKKQFPQDLTGEKIIIRECLIEGEIQGNSITDFFQCRAKFISNAYNTTEEKYFEKTVSEFQKIEKIPQEVEINTWFEDDLFCQVNFWFVCYLLDHSQKLAASRLRERAASMVIAFKAS